MDKKWLLPLIPSNWTVKYQIIGILTLILFLSAISVNPISAFTSLTILALVFYGGYHLTKYAQHRMEIKEEIRNGTYTPPPSKPKKQARKTKPATILTEKEQQEWLNITRQLEQE